MEGFLNYIQPFLAQRLMVINVIESTRSHNPERYHAGMGLLAKFEGDAALFLHHMERAAAILPEDPKVQELLAEAVALATGASNEAASNTKDLLTRPATGEPGRLLVDDLLDHLETCPLEQLASEVASLKSQRPATLNLAQTVLAARCGEHAPFCKAIQDAATADVEHHRVRTFLVADAAESSLDDAEKLATQALQLDDSGRAWEALGSVLFLSGRWADADRAFGNAILRDKTSVFPVMAQAAACARQGENSEMLRLLGQAYEESPMDTKPLLALRDALGIMGWVDGTLQLAKVTFEGGGLSQEILTMLELFVVALASSNDARILDRSLCEQSGVLNGLKLRAAASTGDLQAHINAVVAAIEAGDDLEDLVWTFCDTPVIEKLRFALASGDEETAASLVASLDANGFDGLLGSGLCHISRQEFPHALDALGKAFALNPDSGSLMVALLSLFAPIGQLFGSLTAGAWMMAMPGGPEQLVVRVLLDAAIDCATDVPPLRAHAVEVATSTFTAAVANPGLSDEIRQQLTRRMMVLGQDMPSGVDVNNTSPEPPPRTSSGRVDTIMRCLRPYFRFADRSSLTGAEVNYLRSVGRYDMASALELTNTNSP